MEWQQNGERVYLELHLRRPRGDSVVVVRVREVGGGVALAGNVYAGSCNFGSKLERRVKALKSVVFAELGFREPLLRVEGSMKIWRKGALRNIRWYIRRESSDGFG
jgi:hypothetical protein